VKPSRLLDLPPPSPDKVDRLRDAARRARDLELEIKQMEDDLANSKRELLAMRHEELPDLMSQAGTTLWAIVAEGNLPAFVAKSAPYYKANIAAEWDAERRQRAFDWIAARDPDTKGPGPRGGDNPDIIKTVITIELGRGERELAQKVEAGLRKQGIPFSTRLDVPWNTLTAFVRELVEARKVMPPLDLLGATVGRIVTIKPEKDK